MRHFIASILFLAACSETFAVIKFYQRVSDAEPAADTLGGLYIHRSHTGDSGDLFVSASNDHFVSSPWESEKTVHLVEAQPSQAYVQAPAQVSLQNAVPVVAQQQYYQTPQIMWIPQAAAAVTPEKESDIIAVDVPEGENTPQTITSNGIVPMQANYLTAQYPYRPVVPQYVYLTPPVATLPPVTESTVPAAKSVETSEEPTTEAP